MHSDTTTIRFFSKSFPLGKLVWSLAVVIIVSAADQVAATNTLETRLEQSAPLFDTAESFISAQAELKDETVICVPLALPEFVPTTDPKSVSEVSEQQSFARIGQWIPLWEATEHTKFSIECGSEIETAIANWILRTNQISNLESQADEYSLLRAFNPQFIDQRLASLVRRNATASYSLPTTMQPKFRMHAAGPIRCVEGQRTSWQMQVQRMVVFATPTPHHLSGITKKFALPAIVAEKESTFLTDSAVVGSLGDERFEKAFRNSIGETFPRANDVQRMLCVGTEAEIRDLNRLAYQRLIRFVKAWNEQVPTDIEINKALRKANKVAKDAGTGYVWIRGEGAALNANLKSLMQGCDRTAFTLLEMSPAVHTMFHTLSEPTVDYYRNEVLSNRVMLGIDYQGIWLVQADRALQIGIEILKQNALFEPPPVINELGSREDYGNFLRRTGQLHSVPRTPTELIEKYKDVDLADIPVELPPEPKDPTRPEMSERFGPAADRFNAIQHTLTRIEQHPLRDTIQMLTAAESLKEERDQLEKLLDGLISLNKLELIQHEMKASSGDFDAFPQYRAYKKQHAEWTAECEAIKSRARAAMATAEQRRLDEFHGWMNYLAKLVIDQEMAAALIAKAQKMKNAPAFDNALAHPRVLIPSLSEIITER